jgi:NADH dehydrogenase FAD-containing subunit
MSKMAKTQILIVGGGFGGVKAALELADDEHFQITLLSDSPELRYYPTLYHTATGGQRANSSIPLSTILAGKAVQVVQGRAKKLPL